MTNLRPMSMAPRDGTPVLVRLKSNGTWFGVRPAGDVHEWYIEISLNHFALHHSNDFSGWLCCLPPDTSDSSLLRFARNVAAVLDDEGRAALVCSLLSDGVIREVITRHGMVGDVSDERRFLRAFGETADEG